MIEEIIEWSIRNRFLRHPCLPRRSGLPGVRASMTMPVDAILIRSGEPGDRLHRTGWAAAPGD